MQFALISTFLLTCVSAVKPFVTVAADGSGDVRTVTEAIARIPSKNTAEKIIYIKAGTYNEKVDMRQSFVTIVGVPGKSIIQWDDNAAKAGGTQKSATFNAQGNDVKIFNMVFKNNAPWPTRNLGMAVAFSTKGERMYVENSQFYSWQDTLYYYHGTAYFKYCYIQGQVDYVFGMGRAVFDGSTFHTVAKGDGKLKGYVTADGNGDPAYPGGLFIRNSVFTAQSDVDVYLGRNWGAYAKVLIAGTTLPAQINPAGWLAMNANTKGAQCGEYGNNGPRPQTGRVAWTYTGYTSKPSARKWFGGNTAWIKAQVPVIG